MTVLPSPREVQMKYALLLLLALAAPQAEAVSYSEEVGASLSTTYALATLDGAHTGIVPGRKIEIGLVTCWLTSISSATTVTWYVSNDAAGDQPLTPKVTTTISTGQTSGKGGIAATMDESITTDSTALYVWAKTDAGTATATCRAYWESR